jgi:RimJ/RimL family protein N-acetyltransferase
MNIRQAKIEEAKEYLDLRIQVDKDSEHMLFAPGERLAEVDNQKRILERLLSNDNSNVWVVEENGKLIGFLEAQGGNLLKTRHKVFIVIGIDKDYRGKGLGTELFQTLTDWAKLKKIHRLELTVFADNEVGIKLYKRMGFVEEGRSKDALWTEDRGFVDELKMGRIME